MSNSQFGELFVNGKGYIVETENVLDCTLIAIVEEPDENGISNTACVAINHDGRQATAVDFQAKEHTLDYGEVVDVSSTHLIGIVLSL